MSDAISIIALGLAVYAEQKAAEAAEAACRVSMLAFDQKVATVHGMQEYADCVRLLYPDGLSSVETVGLKILFAVALAGAIGVATHMWREEEGPRGVFVGFFAGLVTAPLAVVFTAGLGYGVYWLFT